MKTAMPKNALSWFEVPVSNFERAKNFYSTILDYQMPEMSMDGYRMGIFPHIQGEGIGGAIVQGADVAPSNGGTLIYLDGGPDLQAVLERIDAAGGSIVTPKMELPDNMGYFAVFRDSEGNKVGLHSPQ